MTEVLTHLWQEQGLGKAPFRALCIISVPSKSLCEANPEAYNNAWRECSQQARALGVELCSCQSCGMSLENNVVIRDAEGKNFVVGCDCAGKVGDTKLTTEVKLLEKARQRKIKEAKLEAERVAREARIAADQAAQRERNGGLTDAEVAARARQAAEDAKREKFTAENLWLLKVLDGMNGDFVASMIEKLEVGPLNGLSDRCVSILSDIYGKAHGRGGSKKYTAAVDEFYGTYLTHQGG